MCLQPFETSLHMFFYRPNLWLVKKNPDIAIVKQIFVTFVIAILKGGDERFLQRRLVELPRRAVFVYLDDSHPAVLPKAKSFHTWTPPFFFLVALATAEASIAQFIIFTSMIIFRFLPLFVIFLFLCHVPCYTHFLMSLHLFKIFGYLYFSNRFIAVT